MKFEVRFKRTRYSEEEVLYPPSIEVLKKYASQLAWGFSQGHIFSVSIKKVEDKDA